MVPAGLTESPPPGQAQSPDQVWAQGQVLTGTCRYLYSWNSVGVEKDGVGNMSPRAFRRRIVWYSHPLGRRVIELGNPPQGRVIYTVVYGTAHQVKALESLQINIIKGVSPTFVPKIESIRLEGNATITTKLLVRPDRPENTYRYFIKGILFRFRRIWILVFVPNPSVPQRAANAPNTLCVEHLWCRFLRLPIARWHQPPTAAAL